MTLRDFFQRYRKAALAFSGGVDSAYLLWAALREGADVRAYYVSTPFQPEFERKDALRLAGELGAPLTVLEVDILADRRVTQNPPNRCYYCKRALFGAILDAARADGYRMVLDGTNASDSSADRPGMRALAELSVRSPLRECGLGKKEIRALSRSVGLFTWEKPAYACLATRIPAGTPITREALVRTERAEAYLTSLGFRDFRVRCCGGAARLQVTEDQLELVAAHREELLDTLGAEYDGVLLDLAPRGKG